MKKVLSLLAAVMLLSSMSFAQQNMARRHVPTQKHERIAPAMRVATPMPMPKTAGDTISTFPWSEGFENGTPAGFSFVDADGDGNNWTIYDFGTTGNGHNGSDMVAASASYINNVGAVTPDNWMILPAFEIPTDASEFNISWYEKGQDAGYAAEYYSVYINTTGNAVANFSAAAVLTSTATGEWVKKTVSLSSYAGQTIFVAFRHHNVTDMFYLDIDDIRVGGAEAPEISIAGPAVVMAGDTAVFTATTTATTVVWNVTADYTEFNGDTAIVVWNTPGNYSVDASATNSAGTTTASYAVNVFSCDAITTFPYVEDFENTENLLCWLTVDADGDGNNWTFDYLRGEGAGFGESDGFAASASYINDALTPDNWLISPAFTLPSSEDLKLSWFVKAQDAEYADEYYTVYVSTTGHSTSDFTTQVYAGMPTGAWGRQVVDLASYAGQTIYVAFRHHNCTDMFWLDIDNVRIGPAEAPYLVVEGPEEARMGEAVEFTATSDVTPIEWSVDGTVQSETGNTLTYTFTTDGNHTVTASATNAVSTTTESVSIEIVNCSNPIELPHTFDLANEFGLCWDNPEDGWFTYEMEDGVTYLVSQSNYYGFIELDPDNWVYTPVMAMPATGSFEIAWKVMPLETQLPSDHYGVYVVQNGVETLLYQETLTADITAPSQRAVAIPETVSGEFKVAFRHYETTGGYYILISDIAVVASGSTQGIDNANAANVAVYPNPASSMLSVEGEGIEQVEIIDVNGRVVMTAEAGTINISALANGVYMVRVVTAAGVSTQKIVKK
jgi:PKD repeat protein